MKSYGQFCPIAKAAELFCERWTALVIRNIAVGAHRFSEIQRGVPLMSATLLSQRLKLLEAEGAVERGGTGKRATYHLTEAGQEFLPMVFALGQWGQRWTRRQLEAGEVDLGLLIWGLEFSVNPSVFGPGRVTIELEFTDQPAHKAKFWFVNEDGTLDLCVTDPGHEVDIWLAATLVDVTYLYNGDLTLAAALRNGRLELTGPPALTRKLLDWFNFSPLTEVEPVSVARG